MSVTDIASLSEAQPKGDSLWIDGLKRLARNRMAVLGVVIIIFFIFVAVFAVQWRPKLRCAGTDGQQRRPPVGHRMFR
jgi:hypothetical protein